MPDYSKGKIYSIKYEDKIVYIGSTTSALNKRMQGHRGDSKRMNTKFYNFMNEKGLDNFKIKLIEDYSCNSKKELLERETYYQRLYPDRYNTLLALLSKEELKIQKAKNDKKYREKDKEETKQRDRKKNAKYNNKCKENGILDYTCECGTHLNTKSGVSRHKKTKKHLDFISNQNV